MANTILILGGGIVALVLVLLLALRTKPSSEQTPPARQPESARGSPPPPATPRQIAPEGTGDKFRGGMVFPQPDPCGPVSLLRGKTFPEGRIPGIPVPGCNRGRCDCQVHTVVGRRRGPRRLDADRRDDVRIDDDRRSGQDRRSA